MIAALFKIVKRITHALFNYSIFVVYSYNCIPVEKRAVLQGRDFRLVTHEEIAKSDDDLISEQAWYGGAGSYLYACFVDGRIVSLCAYWYGDRYITRNFWPLATKEAKLVQLFTVPSMRGKGIAPELIQYSSNAMINQGFGKLFARVWHSNYPSRKAFENSNWSAISTVIEIHPIKKIKPLRLKIARRGK
jgi:GNAT superfamily N-acetyltransferase